MLRRFLIAASALLAWGELVHWRASRKCLGRGDAAKGQSLGQARRRSRAEVLGRAPEARQRDVGEAGVGEEDAVGAGVGKAVVVLGFANRGARANFVNRLPCARRAPFAWIRGTAGHQAPIAQI
ncbi:hypothetical protein HMPREF0972_01975 [Actinomyces sp. oral taxon 848 str. F0332]|nr:hypothetical protein HMPREF0972_01975 [Actinomyces sp. oral taxon 848 str. F0332]